MQKSFYSNKYILDTLANIKLSGRICHAYLITGDSGLGKRTFAKYFARTILCKDDNPPCNNCDSCTKLLSQNHPDVIIVSGKNAKNSIHIEKIRAIRQDAYILPNEGLYKIYIIENSENMTIGATNALLKMLEEPPAHAMFILTAQSTAELLDTVVSRCVEIHLSPVSDSDVMSAVKEITGITDVDTLNHAVSIANGNIGNAITFLTDNTYSDTVNLAIEIINSFISGCEYSMLKAFAGCGKERENIKTVLKIVCDILREALLIKNSVSDNTTYDIAKELADHSTVTWIIKTCDIILEGIQNIDKNANVALLLSGIVAQIKS